MRRIVVPGQPAGLPPSALKASDIIRAISSIRICSRCTAVAPDQWRRPRDALLTGDARPARAR